MPKGSAFSTIDVAIVQGGGEQGTRAINREEREVFERHLEATALIQGNPDIVLWPEDVVNLRQLFIDSPDGTRTFNPNPQFFIFGVEVTLEGWNVWTQLPADEAADQAQEIINRYRK